MDLNQIIWAVLCASIGVINVLIKRQISSYDKRMELYEKRLGDMEKDYINRAEYNEMKRSITALQERIVQMGENIISELHRTQLYAANTFVKKEECLHEGKRKNVCMNAKARM